MRFAHAWEISLKIGSHTKRWNKSCIKIERFSSRKRTGISNHYNRQYRRYVITQRSASKRNSWTHSTFSRITGSFVMMLSFSVFIIPLFVSSLLQTALGHLSFRGTNENAIRAQCIVDLCIRTVTRSFRARSAKSCWKIEVPSLVHCLRFFHT